MNNLELAAYDALLKNLGDNAQDEDHQAVMDVVQEVVLSNTVEVDYNGELILRLGFNYYGQALNE